MASEYLLSLINDVLDMRKIDHNDMKLFEESVNLRAIIENCRDILKAKAAEQEIELDITGLESFQPPQILASEVHLRQVFMNIVSNAIKYNGRNSDMQIFSYGYRNWNERRVSETDV